MKSHLQLPSKKLTRLEKNACETLFVENSKTLLGEGSEANIKRISLPAILFRGAFQICRKT